MVCTGAVVNQRWIVTAAHCILNDLDTGYVSPMPIGNTQVVVGCANLASSSCKTFNVMTLVAHPCYTPSTDQDHDDIAMMQLDSDVQLRPSDFALIDGVQGTAPYAEGDTVTIAGFGMTSNAVMQPSSALMRADIGIATQAYCQQENPFSFSTGYINFSNIVCTGGPAGKDSCNGDSGGPIIYNGTGRPWLIGVLSKGSELPSRPPRPPRPPTAPPLPARSPSPRSSFFSAQPPLAGDEGRGDHSRRGHAQPPTHTHARTHARARARAHTHTHTHTQAPLIFKKGRGPRHIADPATRNPWSDHGLITD